MTLLKIISFLLFSIVFVKTYHFISEIIIEVLKNEIKDVKEK